METRITVIDKVPTDNHRQIPCISETLDLPELLALIEQLPKRSSWQRSDIKAAAAKAIVVQLPKRTTVAQPETVSSLPDDIVVLEYEVVEWSATEGLKDTLYETYRPQRIRMKNALPHPSLLCESAALALVSLEIELTPTQERIYNSYSDAFQVIHHNLDKALEACNISGDKTYNRAAKMSAMSQFESHKQRFFNHLLTGMKCPQLIKAIEEDLAASNAIVIQGDISLFSFR